MKHFLYLCRRDKKGVLLLLILSGDKIPKTYVDNFDNIGLPENIRFKLDNYYIPLRFHWQIVIESDDNFDSIKKRLHKNGYKNIQFDNSPLFLNLESIKLKILEKMPKKMLQKKNI